MNVVHIRIGELVQIRIGELVQIHNSNSYQFLRYKLELDKIRYTVDDGDDNDDDDDDDDDLEPTLLSARYAVGSADDVHAEINHNRNHDDGDVFMMMLTMSTMSTMSMMMVVMTMMTTMLTCQQWWLHMCGSGEARCQGT